MTYPFDIEQIFPAESVRLPRRQAGGSPQDLTLTLLADYTAYTGAWLPSAAIVALLAESGVSTAGARAAVSRLARRGVLDAGRQGRNTHYRLAPAAAADLVAGGRWIASYGTDAETWDDRWTLLAFSLPQEATTQRRALRNHLRWMGYAPLYDALWISPREFSEQAWTALTGVTPDAVTIFRAQHVDLMNGSGRHPLDAWDIDAIAAQYDAFLRRWLPAVPDIRAGRVPGPDAVRSRMEIIDAYRRFSTIDPRLPDKLLPESWLRQPARDVFAAVYDGLAAPAERHVRAVVAAHSSGAEPRIHANTVGDLLLGRLSD
ncbi:putative PaaX-like regulatory protein [Actinoplanes missouriensis 431]|uniref:Putative PaaX-like regulatory protein n=1 Tax=Actinoplanes missouriensis (strain ATCC 14538 / DSM 43046 / CBS 188.64 / JCM 3121 / NBRC 102363 / NCIMB 12654 / NRRL B-3342 / UNCC 431) TaxID=512565 RepID=I0H4T1_ACTM4|nr:PaaX family transcriptional regulator C-terminal domain-containing protein [Actinoplanes missouriensis]BAL88018.1 putative PaaX-like regulatory protein [Actinoplanes missouriensis 431]